MASKPHSRSDFSHFNVQLKEEPNIAPKSWVQMVSFEPPILMFSGTEGNTTENNILQTKCFGLNLVDSATVSKAYNCIRWFGRERIEKSGFTIVKASKINAPLVAECKAHLECLLSDTKKVGGALVVFGEIVAASIWEEILRVKPEKRYGLLDQVLYVEENLFSKIGKVSKLS